MPGPTSDSYDPEFGTGANAQDVRDAIQDIVDAIGLYIGSDLKNIVSVVQSPAATHRYSLRLTEKQLRVVRFGLNRALETI